MRKKDEEYPPKIRGHLLIKATGDRVVLIAKRSGFQKDADGRRFMRYDTTTEDGGLLPATNGDFRAGKVAVEFDMVPGMATMAFQFSPDPEEGA